MLISTIRNYKLISLFIFTVLITNSFGQVAPGDPNAIPVEFRFTHHLTPPDSGVGINGAFNSWTLGVFKMIQYAPDEWKGTIECLPLTYEYKFVTYTDTVGQSGVTAYYTDPLNPRYGGPFNNSYITFKSPMVYYLLPMDASTITLQRPAITANIAVANSKQLDISKIVFIIDGVAIPNASSLYDTTKRLLTYQPTADLGVGDHTVEVDVQTKTGEKNFLTSTFTIVGGLATGPYTFMFDSKSPNFSFLNPVTRVDIKGGFNLGGTDQMFDSDSDGVYTFNSTLKINKPSDYTFIINSGSYINDPDNPNLNTNHQTYVVKKVNSRPYYHNFSPHSGAILTMPNNSISVSCTVSPSDSAYSIDYRTIKVKLDGVLVTPQLAASGSDIIVTTNITNALMGFHTIEYSAIDLVGVITSPAVYTFGVYSQNSGFNFTDGAGDDQGTGSYLYPAGITAGSADIEAVNISASTQLDSLIFTVKMKALDGSTRLGLGIVNSLTGSFVETMQNVSLKIPEWNNKGVYAIVAANPSSFFDPATENKLYISRDPLQSSISFNVNENLTNNTFTFSLPLSALENVMGTYKVPWYFGLFSYLKNQPGTIKVDSTLGGSNIAQSPNVYDVAFFYDRAIQERLLSNYSSDQQIGGPQIAAIGADKRGYFAITPSMINTALDSIPECKLYASGGDITFDTVTVYGYGFASTGTQVSLVVNDSTYKAVINSSNEFYMPVHLKEGQNKIYAKLPFGSGRFSITPSVYYNYIIDHKPTVRISANISNATATLSAANTTDPDGTTLSYAWTQDSKNPAQVVLTGLNTSSASFTIPVVKGEYYFTCTATNANQVSGWGRTVVIVSDTGNAAPDLTKWHPTWVDTSIIYSVFVRTFDQSGTFNALTSRMAELKNLGIDCIWLLPIHPTTPSLGPDNPGYATTDYFNTLPNYGTKTDFANLVQTAHQYGIKIILDHVIQHTSFLHPFMKDANVFKNKSPYFPFYYWDSNNNFQYLFTWVDLPSINYDVLSTRNYLLSISKYWMQNFNIDGYRCDVAWAINDMRTNGPLYWQQFRAQLKTMKPDILLLAEADAQFTRYFDQKFDAAYDWNWFTVMKSVIGGSGSLASLDSAVNYYYNPSYPKDARPMRYLESQDDQRFIEAYGVANTQLAAAFLFSVPGVPMLYAGQEVGEMTFRGNISWNDPQGLRPFYQNLIKVRKTNPALLKGDFQKLINTDPTKVYSFLRISGSSNAIMNFNFSADTVTTTINVPISRLAFDSTASFYLNDMVNNKAYLVVGKDLKNYQMKLDPGMGQILILSTTKLVDVKENASSLIPKKYDLMQNFPNPFNPSTTIRYALPYASHIKISVFNILGQRITVLVDEIQSAGVYNKIWNGIRSASGVYFYTIEATPSKGGDSFMSVKKMILLK